jgi:NAD+ kinase
MPSEGNARVGRAAVVTHGHTRNVDEAVKALRDVAADCDVELVLDQELAAKLGAEPSDAPPDIAVVLGGDGTMLRALTRFLGTGVPVLGVNFGRVGFLTAIPGTELRAGLTRVFGGAYRVVDLPTVDLAVGERHHTAVNDTVVTSGAPGRMIELGHEIDGEDLGTMPCDGLICSTPSGSTAYNLSNGGPVLVWGLEAMAITFVAPHSLHARPLVVGPESEFTITNRSAGIAVSVLVDGHQVAELSPGEHVTARLGTERSLLSQLPEQTFFHRYHDVFGGR